MNEPSAEPPRPRPRPRKALGQHWLVDRRALRRIVAAADIGADDTVIEVGAGTGLLSERLADAAPRLIAVEVDRELAARLERQFAGRSNVTVVAADVLQVAAAELLAQGRARPPYIVMGNLPFFIGTVVVRHFLRAQPPPRCLVVTLQAEVAETMCAAPGRMGFLSVEVQYHARAKLLFYIPPRAFRPPPKVRAAVVQLDLQLQPAVEVDDRDAFFRLVQAGFAAPRKHLRNSLAIGLDMAAPEAGRLLQAAAIEARRRPQTLALQEWAALYRVYRHSASRRRQ
ncbi:MAG: 16S rRNA (adenine(1518)-N(6)/adenine(1519)-N(6))-dimethyltransferase RsmA [Dehalococcoidia bacterium]